MIDDHILLFQWITDSRHIPLAHIQLKVNLNRRYVNKVIKKNLPTKYTALSTPFMWLFSIWYLWSVILSSFYIKWDGLHCFKAVNYKRYKKVHLNTACWKFCHDFCFHTYSYFSSSVRDEIPGGYSNWQIQRHAALNHVRTSYV